MQTKNYIFAISIPILLGAGIIALFLLYRSSVEMQLSIQKERLVYQPGYLQSQLFLTELNDRFETLNAFGLELSALPADVRAAQLAAGAAETDFSQLAVVGPDGALARPDGTTVNVSAEPFFINAMAGKRRIEAFSLDGAPGFAFALPFTDAAGRQALVGFLSEDGLLELLNRSGGQLLFKSLLFDRSGQIIAGSRQIPLFSDQKNVFTAFSALEQKGVLPAGAAKELDGAVSGYPDDAETDDRCISSGDGYYTCHPTGINNWYILNYVRSGYVELSARHTTRQAEFTGGLVLLTALLALTIVTLLHRQRLTVAAEQAGASPILSTRSPSFTTSSALKSAPPRRSPKRRRRRSAPSSPSRSSPSAPSTRSTASTPETTCCARSRSSCAATCARATPPVGSTPTILPGISAATRRRTSMRRCADASAPPRTAVCRFSSAPAFMRSRTAP